MKYGDERATHKRWAEVFHSPEAPRMARRPHNILHETIPLNPKAQRRTRGQPHDAQRRGDVGQSESEEVGNTEGRCHGHEILQLVACTFLHLPCIQSPSPGKLNHEGTDPKPARSVRFHDFSHVADELRERRAHLPMLEDEGFGDALCCAWCRGGAAFEMCTVFASFAHDANERRGRNSRRLSMIARYSSD